MLSFEILRDITLDPRAGKGNPSRTHLRGLHSAAMSPQSFTQSDATDWIVRMHMKQIME